MVAAKNIFFFVSAVSALAIGRRDASTIDSNDKALTSAMNIYSVGLFGIIPIENAESTLDKSINQGTSDAQAASQLSSADSNSIIAAVQNLTLTSSPSSRQSRPRSPNSLQLALPPRFRTI
jgi:hypothetical protein